MAPGGVIDDRRQRDQHDIGGVGGQIAHHRDKGDERGEHPFRRVAHAGAHRGAEQAAAFGDARAEHDDEHIAERMEMGEGRGHFDPQPRDIVGAEQADRGDDLLPSGFGIDLGRV